MKVKRILAFAVAVAMVLSIVPAFTLTASATEATYYATAVGHSGSASGTGIIVAVGGGNLATDGSTTGNSYGAPRTSNTYNAGAGLGSNRIGYISFTVPVPTQDIVSATMRLYVNGVNGNIGNGWFKAAAFRTTGTPSSVTVGNMTDSQYPAVNDEYTYDAANWSNEQLNKNSTGWITFDVTDALRDAVEEASGANATLSFRLQVPTAAYNFHTAATNSALQPELVVETGTTATVSWTLNDTEVATETLTLDEDGNATAPAKAYSENGSNVMYASPETVITGDTTIALTAVANTGALSVGDVIAKDGVQYEIKGANLIPNADFSYGLEGWYNAANGVAGTDKFTVNGDGTITAKTNEGTAAAGSLHRAWAIESGKQYLFTWTSNVDQIYHKVSVKDALDGTADGATVLATSVAGTNNCVFTAANNYIQINFRWLASNNVIGNFGLYEIAEAEVAVTETVASVADIAPVKVIGDTAVVLPATVHVTGSLGSSVNAPIVWDAPASYSVGTVTVTGTATVQFGTQDATEETVSTTVTVLEETFTLDDVTTVNGQSAADESLVKFPIAISDEFNMEFTANYESFGDLWITLKDSARPLYFSPEQIPLGVNASGAFRPVNGNGSGGRVVADSDLAYLTAGTPYRFFITTDASTDKYTVSIYDVATGDEVVTAENFGYRTNADYIDSIVSLTNNGNGSVTLTDIKVNANVEKTEYTFVTTIDGETTTTKASFWSAEEAAASVEDITNYHKEVTVDGTTVTVVYTNMTVVEEEIAAIAEISDITVFVTDEIVLPETVKVTGTFDTEVDAAILWDAPEEFTAGTTDITGTASVQFGEGTPIEAEVAMSVTVIEEFTLPDSESFGAQPGNQVAFPVQIKNNFTMEFDYTINEVADASVQMGGDAGKLFGDAALGISPNGNVLKATGGNTTGTAEGIQLLDSVAAGETYHMILQMNAAFDTYTLYVEKADGSVVSTGEKSFRKAQEYIDTMTVLLNGGNIDNKGTIVVSNIVVNAKDVELCTVEVNGEIVSVIKGRSYKAQTTGIARDDAGTIYAAVDGVAEVLVEGDMAITTQELGLTMLDGAQVRVGNTELGEGEKLDALADSGLRFIAEADYTDTVVADADEFGIKITAEGSPNVAYIKADKFQNGDETVFSAAITNLNESNYNRKYTAVAYAKLDGIEITTGAVTRSIYQVSAGIMKNGAADAENAPYTVDGVVKNILNAYINQTGIRLSYDATAGIDVEEGKYTGDIFFAVTSVSDGDDGFNVTITPDATWSTPASIAAWWTDYVRFNNNNSIAKGYISNAEFVDGALTFNFDKTVD